MLYASHYQILNLPPDLEYIYKGGRFNIILATQNIDQDIKK